MAKITRKTQKILGVNSSNTGIFGNAQKGIYDQFSQDPDVIQTPEWESGWNQAAFSGAKFPPLEERQAVDFVTTRQIAYILQEGIPEWDVGTEYHENSIVKESGTTNLYYSITDDNVGNPVSDPLNWTLLSFGIADGDKGDVTVSASGNTWTINNGAVNTDKLGGDITAAGKALLDDVDSASQRDTLGLGTAAIAPLIDDDTFATATATNVPSAESVKAYVDTEIAGIDTGCITIGTEQATTSGTIKNFTGIPTTAKRITVVLGQVSLTGTDNLLIRIGGSSIETTGYDCVSGTPNIAFTSATNGFIIRCAVAAANFVGSVTLTKGEGNKWYLSGVTGQGSGSPYPIMHAGYKELSEPIQQLSVLTTGTNTFDNGHINIIVEK